MVLNPLPYHDLDRVVRVWDTDPKRGVTMNMVSAGDYLDWREQSRSFERLAAFNAWSGNLTGTDEPERLQGSVVSPDLFPLLGMNPILGRTFDRTAEQAGNDNVLVLSHGLWQRRFASNPNVAGRAVSIDGRPFTILGVMPREFDFPTGSEIWVPLSLSARNLSARDGRHLFVLGRLREGVSIQQASSEMNAIASELGRIYPADEGHGILIRRVREVTNMVTDRFVLVGFAAVSLILAASAFLAAYIPARRASAIDPVVALREE